jgi:DNA replication and repair protein RecF
VYLKALSLKDFRNYEKIELEFNKGFNVLYGFNGQGKTNVLEAIFICASGRSHRTSKDIELIRFDYNEYNIKADVKRADSSVTIEIKYEKNTKKKITLNGIPVKKVGNLMGNLNAVMFSPEDMLIIKEGPSERRRFIDISMSQLKPAYFYDLQQYARILAQRNNLLKEIEKNKSLSGTLDIWNENLVKTGSRIIKKRHEFLNKLNEYAKEKHLNLTNNSEILDIKYVPSFSIKDLDDIKEIENAFKNMLDRGQQKEILKGITLYGPHRDDYQLILNGKNIRMFGSQGQQRTAVLSVKLSELDIMKEDTGEYPILLLDDVMSELDRDRQKYLFKFLKGIQIFITCTDKDIFNGMIENSCSFYNVKNGSITIHNK